MVPEVYRALQQTGHLIICTAASPTSQRRQQQAPQRSPFYPSLSYCPPPLLLSPISPSSIPAATILQSYSLVAYGLLIAASFSWLRTSLHTVRLFAACPFSTPPSRLSLGQPSSRLIDLSHSHLLALHLSQSLLSASRADNMNNMDTNMEDVKMPEPHLIPQPPLEPTTIPTLDLWIAGLLNCKQLAENDVQRLCEKVLLPCRPARYFSFNSHSTIGTRSPAGGIQRPARGRRLPLNASLRLLNNLEMPRHSVRRHPWPVPRSDGAV
jgi:hypothetical protein